MEGALEYLYFRERDVFALVNEFLGFCDCWKPSDRLSFSGKTLHLLSCLGLAWIHARNASSVHAVVLFGVELIASL